MRKTHICSFPTMIFTICYRQSKTGARKWTSTVRNDMQRNARLPTSRHCFCLVVILPAVKTVPATWKTVLLAMRRY